MNKKSLQDSFTPVHVQSEFDYLERESLQVQKRLAEARLRDANQQIATRKFFVTFFTILLIVQHVFVFIMFTVAVLSEGVKDFETILSILVSATLIETYFLAREMVKATFDKIEYSRKS